MTKEQIAGVAEAFGQAAARAKRCGFDGVMLHGAHMYLLSQFFYPEVNHRTDEYGGCARNRFRITEEAFLAVKKYAGDDFPVFMKINGDDRTASEEYFRDVEEVLRLCDDLGMDMAEISGYTSARGGRPDRPYFIDTVKRFREACDLPLMEVGGIRTREDIEQILANGVEMVSMSRPVLCQPDVKNRILFQK
jgi:2,4-dienoyl-CoA reductase-like NADH-dependent reductase (Old Yellow Enzyme family)